MHHFTEQEAKTQLLNEAAECLVCTKRLLLLEFLKRWENTLLLLFAIGAILDFILSISLLNWINYGAFAEGILIILGLYWNWCLFSWEVNLKDNEMYTKIGRIIDTLKNNVLKEDVKIPFTIPTISVGYVFRENNLILLPYSLMVKGDVIRMAYGDRAPERMELISEKIELISDKSITLGKGELLTPKLLGSTLNSSGETFYYFRYLSVHNNSSKAKVVMFLFSFFFFFLFFFFFFLFFLKSIIL